MSSLDLPTPVTTRSRARSRLPCLPYKALTHKVRRALKSIPTDQFVLHPSFRDLVSAFAWGAGLVDLVLGSRGLAVAIDEVGAAPWFLCWDVKHRCSEDLLNDGIRALIEELLDDGTFNGLSGGPVCSSFSTAIVPAWRSLMLREFLGRLLNSKLRWPWATLFALGVESCCAKLGAWRSSPLWRTRRTLTSGENLVGKTGNLRADGPIFWSTIVALGRDGRRLRDSDSWGSSSMNVAVVSVLTTTR